MTYLTQFSRNFPSGLGVIAVFPCSLSSGVLGGWELQPVLLELGTMSG